jgi:hypothetical protein
MKVKILRYLSATVYVCGAVATFAGTLGAALPAPYGKYAVGAGLVLLAIKEGVAAASAKLAIVLPDDSTTVISTTPSK